MHPSPDRPTSKREAILEASMQVLATKGFHGFFIKQVADHAGWPPALSICISLIAKI